MSEQLTPQKKQRLIFIDVMRGLAVLWMIETHVVDVVLYGSLKGGFFYNLLNISNGFVAVSFLFCAGAGFWLAAQKKADDYKHFRPPLWVYLRRIGLILVLAYWLHFPALSLEKFLILPPEGWLTFFECDVLQAIGYSSILALIILMITPNMKYLPYIFGLFAVIVFLSAPFVWNTNPLETMPTFIGNLFSRPPNSKFPLFPWMGYFFSGAAITAYFMNFENKKKLAMILSISGLVLVILLFNTRYITDFYPGFKDWWHCSPFHSLFRVSGAVMVFAFLYLIEKWYKEKKIGNILRLCGQESLYVYISHLMIVYGSVANFGMSKLIGNRLDWFGTAAITFAVCLFCWATALGWNNLKAKEPRMARIVMISVFVLFFIIFLFNPA